MQEQINKYFNIIAKNVKFFRERENLSQEALAEKVNLSREFINRVENCKETLSLSSLLILALVLNIKPEDFFK